MKLFFIWLESLSQPVWFIQQEQADNGPYWTVVRMHKGRQTFRGSHTRMQYAMADLNYRLGTDSQDRI
jgi:hypothetical protein